MASPWLRPACISALKTARSVRKIFQKFWFNSVIFASLNDAKENDKRRLVSSSHLHSLINYELSRVERNSKICHKVFSTSIHTHSGSRHTTDFLSLSFSTHEENWDLPFWTLQGWISFWFFKWNNMINLCRIWKKIICDLTVMWKNNRLRKEVCGFTRATF